MDCTPQKRYEWCGSIHCFPLAHFLFRALEIGSVNDLLLSCGMFSFSLSRKPVTRSVPSITWYNNHFNCPFLVILLLCEVYENEKIPLYFSVPPALPIL